MLLVAGRSNAQIGTELFISRGTAAVHVTSILRKLGITKGPQIINTLVWLSVSSRHRGSRRRR